MAKKIADLIRKTTPLESEDLFLVSTSVGSRSIKALDMTGTLQGPVGPQGPVGAVGSQGIEGIQGETGVQGPEGQVGPQGIQGEQGTQGIKGEQGTQGPQGDKGDQGEIGPQGLQGEQGIQGQKGDTGATGETGAKGDQGLQGQVGLKGDQGEIGSQGTQGIQGEVGSQGIQGIQGVQGDKGDNGDQGIQGIQGSQGIQGIQGETGTQGPEGQVGPQGIQGEVGPQGEQGSQGIQGIQGIQGEIGSQGPQGLKGDQGETGSQGLQGEQGIQGIQGIQGEQGIEGIQGIQGEQGLVGLQGIQGEKGDKGDQGIQGFTGQDGTSFSIAKIYSSLAQLQSDSLPGIQSGEFAIISTLDENDTDNSKLFVWNGSQYNFVTDLSGAVGIQGPQGTQGIQGEKGNKGDQGEQGLIGLQGIQGTQGNQGEIGPQGLEGIQGIQGIQGAEGSQGFQGLQGLQGIQGEVGSQGAQGIQGEQGIQGSQGEKGDKGDQGEIGLQGLQGVQGEVGTEGSQGIQGIQGEQGLQGIQGQTGLQGPQGIEGLKGETGSQGIEGLQGLKGDQGEIGLQGIQGEQGLQGIEGPQGLKGDQGEIGLQGEQGLPGETGDQGDPGPEGLTGEAGPQGAQGIQGNTGIAGAGVTTSNLVQGEQLSIGALTYVSPGTGNDSARITGALYKLDLSNSTRNKFAGIVQSYDSINPHFSEDFSSGNFTNNGWTEVNGTQANKWHVGSATFNSSSYSVYISSNLGVSNTYNVNIASAVYFYKDIFIPNSANSVQLRYSIKATGEYVSLPYDYGMILIDPNLTTVPVAGTPILLAPSGGTRTLLAPSTSWSQRTISVNAYKNTTIRLIFGWVNDPSLGTNPPIAIDDIKIEDIPTATIQNSGLFNQATGLVTGSYYYPSATAGAYSSSVPTSIASPIGLAISATEMIINPPASNSPSLVPSGTVMAYASSGAPTGYFSCNGLAVSRVTYYSLYSAIGTQYGQGDGSTTFNVPDYQGMFLRGRVTTPASVTGTGTPATNNATFSSHGIYRNGFKVRFTSVGTLTGVGINLDYYAIVVDSNTLAFAATLANATAGTPTKILLGGTNNAVIAQWEDPDASSRSQAATGGNGGMSVGSLQDSANLAHNHIEGWAGVNVSSSFGVTTTATAGNINTQSGTSGSNHSFTSTTGSIESRPKNISINYIIKT